MKTNRGRKALSMITTAILGMSLLAGCAAPKGADQTTSSASTTSKELKIGLVTQLSGGGALYGKQMQQGAQLAVDEINEAGGIKGKKLKLLAEDDQANPSESVKVTQRLVSEENINAWIGTLKSSDTVTDVGITSKQNIPSFVPIAVADSVTQAGYKNLFRNVANNGMQIKELVDYILKNQPHQKMAIIAENTDYGRGIADTFTKLYTQGGRTITNTEFYNVGQKDFNDQLTKIKAKQPDSILIAGLVAEGSLITKQAKDLGLTPQLYSFGGFMGAKPIELAGDSVNGLIHTEYFSPNVTGDDKITAFVNSYQKKYGEIPDSYYSAATYDAVYLYAEGVKQAGSEDSQKVIDALHAIKSYHGVMGNIGFDENGQAATRVSIGQIQNGKQTVIYHP